MANISISQMDTRAVANLSDLFEVAYADEQSSTGYASGKMSAEVIANGIVNDFTYTSAMPNMGNRTIAGAMNTMLEGFAPAYDDTQTYAVGDYCTYAGKMYKCTTAVTTAGAWDSTKWTEATCAEEFGTDVEVDSALSTTSENPVQNKVITQNINSINANLVSTKTTAKADIVSISDAQDIPAEDVKADIEPVQDLHGYSSPWVGGAGKNLLPMTVEQLKIYNRTGAWSGNTYTTNGVIFTFNTDNGDNITSIEISGTPNARAFMYITNNLVLPSGEYKINGYVGTQDYQSGISMYYYGMTSENIQYVTTQDGGLFTANENLAVVLNVANNTQIPSNTIAYPMIRLATVTDPTFAPYSNICPISGYDSASYKRCGKNIANVTGTDTNNGYVNERYITSTGDLSTNVYAGFVTEYLKIKANTQYVLSGVEGVNPSFALYDNKKNLVRAERYNNRTTITFTTASNETYIRLSVANIVIDEVQLEQGTTATTYQPYQGQTYTVQFKDDQDQSMTVYSGTLDVTTGVLVVDKAMVDLGDLTWTYYSEKTAFATALVSQKIVEFGEESPYLCSHYETQLARPYTNWTVAPDKTIFESPVEKYIVVRDNRYTDATTFATAMDGVQLLYELATPQVYSLTPTQIDMLLNNNVISASTGKIQVKYQPANVIGELKKLIYQLTNQ